MLVQPIQLHKNNKLIHEYRKEQNFVTDYFDYKPFTEVKKRALHVQELKRDRQELAEILYHMNKKWGAPASTFQQIERLKDAQSVVVIGGQQAGLLSGPLYSLNKLISVYRYAKEQEAELKVPVIPVFWIAGEDHDYDEVNHIYTVREEKVHKHITKQQENFKKSVSHIDLDKEKTEKWLREAFLDLQETNYTSELYDSFHRCLQESDTLVDFFAKVMFTMFGEEGIVFIDSADDRLRQFEQEAFLSFIEKNDQMASAVYETVQTLQQQGYNIPLEVEEDDAHLFYHDENGERILLKREGNHFVGKNEELVLTREELIHIAKNKPEKLSNNVVTRPIMQELIFPTLAFVAGDGEISYWAALKKAFHHLGEKMPLIVPRLSFTYITNRLEKLLSVKVIDAGQAIREGVAHRKIQWLQSQQQPPVEQLFEETKKSLEKIHAPLQEMTGRIAPDLHEASKTNLHLLLEQLEYLHRKTEQTLYEKNEEAIHQFDELDRGLHPNEGLQERVYSPLPLLNEYGFNWIKQLNNLPDLSFTEEHYAIYLHG